MSLSKADALLMIAEKVQSCTKCKDLSDYRIANNYKTVPGHGNPGSRILIVGEAPGQNEAEEGLPFVGRSGKLLDQLLKQAGLKREDLFVVNILKCRPPDNRPPTRLESVNCRPYLDLQIQVIQPKYIVCLGKTAALHLLKPENCDDATKWFAQPLNAFRGKFHEYKGIKTACTFHPSYLLRNVLMEKQFLSDMKMVLEDLVGENSQGI